MTRNLRRKKLIRPGLQLHLISVFLSVAGIALVVQAIVLNQTMLWVSRKMPHDAPVLMEEWPRILVANLLVGLALLLPLTLALGIHATFRIVGPMHRFQAFLESVVEGKRTEPCAIREGDEFQEFCKLLNRATEPQRRKITRPTATSDLSRAA